MKYFITTILLICSLNSFSYPNALYKFANKEQQRKFREITRSTRCLVCQNETIDESQAKLAKDLREQVYHLVVLGEKTEEIRAYLMRRYGNFILYKPPVSVSTNLLWFGPLLLLLIGSTVALRFIKRKS